MQCNLSCGRDVTESNVNLIRPDCPYALHQSRIGILWIQAVPGTREAIDDYTNEAGQQNIRDNGTNADAVLDTNLSGCVARRGKR
jgi:hypothetical protein